MDFEQWMAKSYSGEFDMPHPSEAYEAGQQRKQAEIDALKAKIQELWTELDDRQSKEYIIERCESIIKEILHDT